MSNLIKSSFYISLDEKKTIEVVQKENLMPLSEPTVAENVVLDDVEIVEALKTKEQILEDAENMADATIRKGQEEVEQLKRLTQEEIEQWWGQRRAEDGQFVEDAKNAGFEQGYEEGRAQIEEEINAQYAQMLDQAKATLEQAHDLKRHIIQESEPFLLELSLGIARKILDRQLTVHPEWSKDLVKKALERHRMTGKIAICVSPAQFTLLQDAREELLLTVGAQSELQILPDASVTDQGCVVRTSYGNIDARIDTQLKEIKEALMLITEGNEANSVDE